MKHTTKRLFSVLLALVLMVGLIPGTASASVDLTGIWQTDLTMSAADLGVNAPDSVLRATLTFTGDGHVTADWEAVDLTAFQLFFHDMFVNAYYAVAYGAGITDINEIERFCMDSTGMSVSAYMDTIVTGEAITAAFTPASTHGLYMVDGSNVYLDLELMGNFSNPDIPNPITMDGNTLYLNAASFGKSDFTFTCTRLPSPEENPLTNGNPIGSPFRAGHWNSTDSSAFQIHNIDVQKLDNDHYRFIVSYSAPSGSRISISGERLDGQTFWNSWNLPGTQGEFSFDLPFSVIDHADWYIGVFSEIGDGYVAGAYANLFGTGRYLTGGQPVSSAYVPSYYFEESHLAQVHSVTAQELENDCVRYTIEYTANDVLNISVFDPPNGDTFMYYGVPTTPGERTSLTFDVDNAWLDSITGITFKFFKTEEESVFGHIELAPQEEPVTNIFPVGYWYNHSDDAAIRSIEGQRMDNGDTRYTVTYTAPFGAYMQVIDDSGNQLFTSPLSGNSGYFYIDFCPYQMPTGEWHIQITDGTNVLANASLFGDGSNNSGGNPNAAAFNPYYSAPDSELVTIHDVTAQYLDNGYIRFSIDYTARTSMNITAFSPPNGDLFSCRSVPTVPGQRTTFTFDVLEQHLYVNGLTLNFYDHTYGPAFGMIDAFRGENETEIA